MRHKKGSFLFFRNLLYLFTSSLWTSPGDKVKKSRHQCTDMDFFNSGQLLLIWNLGYRIHKVYFNNFIKIWFDTKLFADFSKVQCKIILLLESIARMDFLFTGVCSSLWKSLPQKTAGTSTQSSVAFEKDDHNLRHNSSSFDEGGKN